MARRLPHVSLVLIFLLALVLNVYVLFSAVDGTRLVQQVEAAAGQGLNCHEVYQARAINAYFDLQHPQQGEALYLLSLAWPVWFAVSIGIAFGLTGVMAGLKRWRWLPILIMGLLVLLLILYLPAIAKISCAID
jgi:hypothetical protein